MDRLTLEREAAEKRDKENRELQREYYRLKEQHDELKEKMRFFTKVSVVVSHRLRRAYTCMYNITTSNHTDLGGLICVCKMCMYNLMISLTER